MTEPPAKRAKRIDSSTMWDVTDRHSTSRPIDGVSNDTGDLPKRGGGSKEDMNKPDSRRGDRRQRSRSRDWDDRRRDRSRSRERRNRDYTRESRRDIGRDGRGTRGRDRSISRERQSSRRDYGSKPTRYRERSHSRSITRSRSPARNGRRIRTRSPPPSGPKSDRKDTNRHGRYRDDGGEVNGVSDPKRHSTRGRATDEMELDANVDPDDLGQAMMKTMGFSSFRSTQNTKVPGNNIYGVRKERKSEYRQYMNRMGGFNRPLSPSR